MQRHNRRRDTTEVKQEPGVTVEFTLTPQHRRREKAAEPAPNPAAASSHSRIPRITRLMALAIKFQDMVDRGEVHDYADLARLGYVSRARMTQIMNLLHLAPDIQEELLGLPVILITQMRFAERHLRVITGLAVWADQRQIWRDMKAQSMKDHEAGRGITTREA